jgi:hypothetical protein
LVARSPHLRALEGFPSQSIQTEEFVMIRSASTAWGILLASALSLALLFGGASLSHAAPQVGGGIVLGTAGTWNVTPNDPTQVVVQSAPGNGAVTVSTDASSKSGVLVRVTKKVGERIVVVDTVRVNKGGNSATIGVMAGQSVEVVKDDGKSAGTFAGAFAVR